MSEYEIPCIQFDLVRQPGESWGLKIAGGIDQDASLNQFCPGDSGIFIISLDPNGIAAQSGKFLDSFLSRSMDGHWTISTNVGNE